MISFKHFFDVLRMPTSGLIEAFRCSRRGPVHLR
jgi:hypothetical protein